MSAEIESLIFAKLETLSEEEARHILGPAEGVNA
jgi:hypothetical protein